MGKKGRLGIACVNLLSNPVCISWLSLFESPNPQQKILKYLLHKWLHQAPYKLIHPHLALMPLRIFPDVVSQFLLLFFASGHFCEPFTQGFFKTLCSNVLWISKFLLFTMSIISPLLRGIMFGDSVTFQVKYQSDFEFNSPETSRCANILNFSLFIHPFL